MPKTSVVFDPSPGINLSDDAEPLRKAIATYAEGMGGLGEGTTVSDFKFTGHQKKKKLADWKVTLSEENKIRVKVTGLRG